MSTFKQHNYVNISTCKDRLQNYYTFRKQNQHTIIIDFKTVVLELKPWAPHRLNTNLSVCHPQLLIFSYTNNHQPKGISINNSINNYFKNTNKAKINFIQEGKRSLYLKSQITHWLKALRKTHIIRDISFAMEQKKYF